MRYFNKAFLFISFFCIFNSGKSKAQGNLQFNQVVLYDLAVNATQNITVPVGKVWKMETVGKSTTSATCSVMLQNAAAQSVCYLTGSEQINFPLWLPSGFNGVINFLGSCAGNRAIISIIEFNVIP